VNLQSTIEPNWNNLIYAVYAEEKDNNVKINAKIVVGDYVEQGGVVKKIEDRIGGIFVGIEVYLQGILVFSKYRKTI
jgi:hypothetical protein